MIIIEFEKTYSDGHSVRLEFQASNVAYVHIDNNHAGSVQLCAEHDDYDNYADRIYAGKFNGNIIAVLLKSNTFLTNMYP